MEKPNIFDKLLLFSLLAALFTVGFHLGKGGETSEKIEFEMLILPVKISGEPSGEAVSLIDGKYECRVLEFGRERIVLLCEGFYTDAGYLLSGAKYVSAGQPLRASQEWGYFEGVISDIRFGSESQNPSLTAKRESYDSASAFSEKTHSHGRSG